jgi:hypothetical protein
MTTFHAWIEIGQLPGLQIPLDSLAVGNVIYRERVVAGEGQWVMVSVPLASEMALRYLLPCTIVARAQFGSRVVRHGVKMFDLAGSISTLVPWDDRFAVQTIAPQPFSGGDPNKICVLRLLPRVATPGGTALEVTGSDCVDCSDLDCGAACAATVGWVFIVPGGLGTITGGG